jgi:tRNA1(Val) A37 N6-methylase TrmN6
MASPAEADLTDDRLLGGRLRFLQPRRGYRVAIDPVLLAAAVPARPGERVLDAGAGTGAAALCLAARLPGVVVIGLERDEALLAVARRNAAANAATAPIAVVAGDLLAPADGPPFDQVMSNPPYHRLGAATPPGTATGAAAHLSPGGLAAWIGACLARLRPLGRLTVIHSADALAELLAALAGRAGDLVVFPLWPSVEAPAAKRVIVAARKGGRGPSRLARGLVLHRPDGRFTDAAEAVLRDGAPLAP